MRTTIDLDAPLLERAKRRAARQGQTLSQLVREAVSAHLARRAHADDEPFELVTCGEPGGYAPTPAEMAAALENDDVRPGPRKIDAGA
ncbi:MAG: CopG family transcriptional regulator [Deltaproteobacteria bacterium]|nr:CopG family transcriptional regulator [Deltaproteobacteria bacterium]